jgi:hypothetical protein
MSERLKADLKHIGIVSKQIKQLAGEFQNATELADGYAAALGSAQLASALNSFASNWSIHRQQLIDDLSKEADLADTAVAAYHGTDEQLARVLTRQEASNTG